MTKGKLVLVPFPFDDLSSSKVRPALCLTEPVGQFRHVVVAFVTSRRPADPEDSDLAIGPDHTGFSASGLKVASTVRLHRVMTLPASAILRELGALPTALLAEVDRRLRALFRL